MYRVDVVILVEIEELTWRTDNPLPRETNGKCRFIEESIFLDALTSAIIQ